MSWWKQLFEQPQPPPTLPELSENEDMLYRDAAFYVASTGNCSISALQRHLKVGYNRAALLIEALENDLVISPTSAEGTRYLLSEAERERMRLLPSKAEILRQQQDEETALRLAYLLEKYSDARIVKQIMSCTIWDGMTAGQLFDTLGHPEALDQKYLKSKSREIWKYNHQSGNRFGLRVTLENGIVVGWDSKS